MLHPRNVPLIGQAYIFQGKDEYLHEIGKTYRVVATGFHWIKAYGFVVWVTTNEYPETTDIDYCMSYHIDAFHQDFWKA